MLKGLILSFVNFPTLASRRFKLKKQHISKWRNINYQIDARK